MERVESFSWRGGAQLALPGHQLQRFPAALSELRNKRGSAGRQRCLERIKASGAHVLAGELTVKKRSKGKRKKIILAETAAPPKEQGCCTRR